MNMFKSTLSINEESVSVVVSQPSDPGGSRAEYNSAYRQCWTQLMSEPPQNFDVELSGRASTPSTEVVIKRCLLEKIPLLHDIGSNTCDAGSASEAEQRTCAKGAQIELPCSVWGLVSLLLLLDPAGRIIVKDWFEANWQTNDPSLPAQTLELADFLGCKDMKSSLLGWLQQVVTNVTGASEHVGSTASNPADSMQSWMNNWYLIEVLRALPDAHAVALFSAMPSFQTSHAAALPQNILSKWVAAQGPMIDIREAKLSDSQCIHVEALYESTRGNDEPSAEAAVIRSMQQFCLSATARNVTCTCSTGCGFTNFWASPSKLSVGLLCKNGCNSLVLLDKAPRKIVHARHGKCTQPLNGVQDLIQYADVSDSFDRCPGCGSASKDRESLVVLGYTCDKCNKFWRWPSGPVISPSVLKARCTPKNDQTRCGPTPLISAGFAEQALLPLEAVAAQMTNLTTLGLYNLPITLGTMRSLGHVLYNLPTSVTSLTLSTQVDAGSTVGAAEQLMLFKTIALVRSVRTLILPQWSTVVGQDATVSTEPLRSLPNLEHIAVGAPLSLIATEPSVFPTGFNFVPIMDADSVDEHM